MTPVLTDPSARCPSSAADGGFDVVTGAFSYSGTAIAATASRPPGPDRHRSSRPRGRRFDRRPTARLRRSARPRRLAQASTTLYNTYWVRFARGRNDHALAVANSRLLFHARPARAGVERIVHVSITNPTSPPPTATSGARRASSGRSPRAASRTQSCVRRCCSAVTACWSTTLLAAPAVPGLRRRRTRRLPHPGRPRRRPRGAGRRRGRRATGRRRRRSRAGAPTFLELVHRIRDRGRQPAPIVHVPGPGCPSGGPPGLASATSSSPRDEYRAMAAGLADCPARPPGRRRLSTGCRSTARHSAALRQRARPGTFDSPPPRRDPPVPRPGRRRRSAWALTDPATRPSSAPGHGTPSLRCLDTSMA